MRSRHDMEIEISLQPLLARLQGLTATGIAQVELVKYRHPGLQIASALFAGLSSGLPFRHRTIESRPHFASQCTEQAQYPITKKH